MPRSRAGPERPDVYSSDGRDRSEIFIDKFLAGQSTQTLSQMALSLVPILSRCIRLIYLSLLRDVVMSPAGGIYQEISLVIHIL